MGEQAVIVKEEEPEDLSLRTREVIMPIFLDTPNINTNIHPIPIPIPITLPIPLKSTIPIPTPTPIPIPIQVPIIPQLEDKRSKNANNVSTR